ncbi:MAG: hypothetical protein AAGI03_08245 [Pseudomonadota bacterium]
MPDPSGPKQKSLFTYGVGLICGLPLASWASTPLTEDMGETAAMMALMALTLVFGAAGAALGYAIDRMRDGKGREDGQGD